MCLQQPPNDYSQELYNKYRGVIDHYNKETVSNNYIFVSLT